MWEIGDSSAGSTRLSANLDGITDPSSPELGVSATVAPVDFDLQALLNPSNWDYYFDGPTQANSQNYVGSRLAPRPSSDGALSEINGKQKAGTEIIRDGPMTAPQLVNNVLRLCNLEILW